MVKRQRRKQSTRKQLPKAATLPHAPPPSIVRITPDTPYATCSERLTAFGGLLALVKFLDLIGFPSLFAQHYVPPQRQTKLGHDGLVTGILMLLFIGFQRLGHFAYLRHDAMRGGILRVAVVPAVSTFWRYLQAMGLVQSQSLLRLSITVAPRGYALNTLISTSH